MRQPAVERPVAVTVPNVKQAALLPHVLRPVLPAASVVTDKLNPYTALGTSCPSNQRIAHGEGVLASGNVHTDTLEGFWSLVERGIDGTHRSVSAEHLQGHLNECAWWCNHRDRTSDGVQSQLLLRRYAFVVAGR